MATQEELRAILKEKEEKLAKHRDRESAVEVAIAFLAIYNGQQGYYDFFRTKQDEYGFSDVFKMHYYGAISDFAFLTEAADGTLWFAAKGAAIVNVEYSVDEKERFRACLFQEIRNRSHKNILNSINRKLAERISPYYDGQIRIDFGTSWRLKDKYE